MGQKVENILAYNFEEDASKTVINIRLTLIIVFAQNKSAFVSLQVVLSSFSTKISFLPLSSLFSRP